MKLLSRLLQPAAAALADLPSECRICHAWPARAACDACLAAHARAQTRCRQCARPLPARVPRCGDCLRQPPPFDALVTAVRYAWPWDGWVAQLKFNHDVGLASPMAALMRAAPGAAALLSESDALLPVPLAPERLSQRGFNQALLLARALRSTAHPTAPLRTDLLLRTRDTPAQRPLPRAERLKNLRGAFAVDPMRVADVQGRSLLLVDDVTTTSATLRAAAQALRDAGAARVSALVFARTD